MWEVTEEAVGELSATLPESGMVRVARNASTDVAVKKSVL
jgi:hypothetical protein